MLLPRLVLAAVLAATTAAAQDPDDACPEPMDPPIVHAICGAPGTPPCGPGRSLMPKPSRWKPLAIYAGGELADGLSTAYFQSKGWREGALGGGSTGWLVAKKAGAAAALTLLDLRAQRSRHVRATRIGYAISRVLLTAWNIHQGSGLNTITETRR